MNFRNQLVRRGCTLGALLVGIGSVSLIAYFDPSFKMNLGPSVDVWFGIAVLLIGGWVLLSTMRMLVSRRITQTKGDLRCSIEGGLFTQIVRRLWAEFFARTDLSVFVSVKKRTIIITGEVPEGWKHTNALASFLSRQLLLLTGYWGEISLHTASKKTS